ncbi:MAG: patatin-like phospholipase family protein, partial [Chloroflexota bacterium]|nr:patatin-like phospholipase family protein [Chloroflexota bacterium]
YDLVFEGGGAKGMVFVGAMQEFEARGHSYDRLMGTSAGAITATFLAAGYDSAEMQEALDEKLPDGRHVFADFLSTPTSFTEEEINNSVLRGALETIDLPFIPTAIETRLDDWIVETLLKRTRYAHLFSFVERGGWYAADEFMVWLQRKLDSGTFQGSPRHFSPMTLEQFYYVTNVELTLIAADTTGGRLLVLNHHTAPDCPVVWAVRMSMSLPLLWQEVIWQPEWRGYRDREVIGHAIVDGGMLSNFPIELFVSDEPHVTAVMGPKRSENILGLLIDETLPVEGAPPVPSHTSRLDAARLRTVRRVRRLIDTMTQAHDKMVLEALEELVVRLPAEGYGTTEFDMSDERRATLIEAGRRATQQYFETPPLRVPFHTRGGEAQAREQINRIATQLLER